MNTARYLAIVSAKGGLTNEIMEVFGTIGISCDEMRDKASRRLISANEDLDVCSFLAKTSDVPTYVGYRAADIGIVGRDTILERGCKLYEVMDPEVGKCRMCVCGSESARERLEHHELVRVATKYPNIVEDYFCNQKYQIVEIIKLNGSIGLVPIVGLSEVIADIVETGSTLRENGLMILKEACDLSARMVVNRVSAKTENERIAAIIKKFQSYLRKSAGRQDNRSKPGK